MIRVWMTWLQLKFWQDEKGMGTIEVVVIMAALIVLALAFKGFAKDFLISLGEQIKADDSIQNILK